MLLLFAYLVLLLSIFLISLTSKGSPIFIQERVGLRGRIFKQYKLRTMVENAEILKENLLLSNDKDGPTFKMNSDPRVTFIGKIYVSLVLMSYLNFLMF